MAILDYVEYAIARTFSNAKGRDAGLFQRTNAFASLPKPNMTLESPDCGPSNSNFDPAYTQMGEDKFPEFAWSGPEGVPQDSIKEYILICEDVDAPLPKPIMHGLFCAIPPSVKGIKHADTEVAEPASRTTNLGTLKNGWRFVGNIRGKHYAGPKPLLEHGPHRYFYTIVALNQPIGLEALGKKGKVTREAVAEDIVGKVVGWAEWVGSFERKWGVTY